MKTEIQVKLEKLAYECSIPFCYSDYIECSTGTCPKCGSDDLMRLVRGVGCEYGVGWVIEHILESELEPADLEEAFEESVRQCYAETTKVGWMEFDTVSLMKDQDIVSWNCAQSEWESQEADDGNIISFDNGSTYYWPCDLERLSANERTSKQRPQKE
jgi:hypothetical protein